MKLQRLGHDVDEPWVVTETGEDSSPSQQFPAGFKRQTFTAPPVELFSCTSCDTTGTAVLRMIATGKLRALRVGRVWRIPAAALDDYLAGANNLPKEGEKGGIAPALV